MLGIDVYNCILILRTEQAVRGFRTHHFTVGAEVSPAHQVFTHCAGIPEVDLAELRTLRRSQSQQVR